MDLVLSRKPHPMGVVMGTGMPVPDVYCCKSRSLLSFHRVVAGTSNEKEETVGSRFRKLSHSIWHCQYHIVWVPKYRYRILHGTVKESVETGVQAICGYAGCEVVELNVQPDHVHLVVMIPPKLSISDLLGRLKGQTWMKLFQQFRNLRKKPYWGNHFWAKGYCV